MGRTFTERQKNWFKQASKEERETFLAKGPAYVEMLLNMKTGKEAYAPFIRGISLGSERYDNAKAAQESADRFMTELNTKPLPTIDEHALGISDENQLINELCWDGTFRINRILHLGAMIADGLGSDADWAFKSIIGPDAKQVKDEIPWLKKCKSEEDIPEYMCQTGQMGFLVEAETPRMAYRSENGATYSWGCYTSRWFYGETLIEAMQKAVKWVEQERESEKAVWAKKQEVTA